MFFSLSGAAVEVGTHLYLKFAGLTVHGQVLLVIWVVIAIILSIASRALGIGKILEPSLAGITRFEHIPLIPITRLYLPSLESGHPVFQAIRQFLDKILSAVRWHVFAESLVGLRALRGDGLDKFPIGFQNFVELVFEYVSGIAKDQIGEYEYRPWVPFVGTLFLFIFVANWLGALLPWKLIGEVAAPTNDINTTVALSLLTSINYFYGGLKAKGLGFFARYILPTPIFLPINILEDFTKPLSLSFRLFGNILADEIVVSVLCLLVPFFVPLPVMVLGIFASSVQALVFSTLSAAYIGESIE